jgi:hypothetical protein
VDLARPYTYVLIKVFDVVASDKSKVVVTDTDEFNRRVLSVVTANAKSTQAVMLDTEETELRAAYMKQEQHRLDARQAMARRPREQMRSLRLGDMKVNYMLLTH